MCEASFASSRSSFRKARVGYSIPCWSALWPCTPGSPLPIGPADIHPGFLVRHPFKSPFTPISQIAEGQLFEIWEYYLIFRRGWVGEGSGCTVLEYCRRGSEKRIFRF